MTYEIKGGNLPAVVCQVNAGETMVTESGGLAWMTPNMKMETTTGGGFGKALARTFSNEHMFQTRYTAEGGPGTIAFTSSFPGEIRALEITPDKPVIVQKSAYLASETGVELSTVFQKKMGAGFFSGEGFIMSKLSGQGTAFLEINGSVVEYDLAEGQEMIVATGYLAAMSESCTMDVVLIKGVKNVLFGGESFFNTVVKGPGRILIQTMPIMRMAEALIPYMPSKSS
ncbi:MAG: TIGR00266 family protein [Lachnospiraceae bacterium]|nr:TIGR00266 family protein [Lachnospiraceae bacterium]